MPLASLYLVSLASSASIPTFIAQLSSQLDTEQQPILVARAVRWIVDAWLSSPTSADQATLRSLTSSKWDLLLIFPTVVYPLPLDLQRHIESTYYLTTGISSKIIASYLKNNHSLLHPPEGAVPTLTGSTRGNQTASSSKDLQITDSLLAWLTSSDAFSTAPSMLNLLSFHPGKQESYMAYGKAFATDVGKKRGGLAKIVGLVPDEAVPTTTTTGQGETSEQQQQQQQWQNQQSWQEVAVAHYPSLEHFADMLMGEDYQAANQKHRVPALRGTALLCCNELDAEVLEGLEAAKKLKSKM